MANLLHKFCLVQDMALLNILLITPNQSAFFLITIYGALCSEGKDAGYFKSSLRNPEEYRRDTSTVQLIAPPRLKNMEQIEDILRGTCPTTVKFVINNYIKYR